MERAIITACSNKFSPAVITLIASIKINYPNHPTIYVYDLGIFPSFKKEIESIDNVKIIKMPEFCNYWQGCYTWKTYIFNHPLARVNLYLDSGFQILKSLDNIFTQIDQDDYFAVAQNTPLETITPLEFKNIFSISEEYYQETYITAGLFGFKKDSSITKTLNDLYGAGIAGLCLGFSPIEKWRNRGKNKNQFTRNCKLFRFDTTILSLLMRRNLKNFKVSPQEPYELGEIRPDMNQLMFNARLKNIDKRYLLIKTLHKTSSLCVIFNRMYIYLFLMLKKISNVVKGKIRK